MKKVGGSETLAGTRGKPWQVDIEGHGQQARRLSRAHEEGSLISPQGGQDLKQLRAEHTDFKRALELIAAGGEKHLALDALGLRFTYDELEARNRELNELTEFLAAALEGIRDGTIQPSQLPTQNEDGEWTKPND
jgi:hypothetical protein